jgi:hypothetical protein
VSAPALPPSADDLPVAAYRAWVSQLMVGADRTPTPRSLDLRKLRLTEGFREALRQAPGAQPVLFGIWDAAYRTLERLQWEVAPPALDPPPPPPEPTFEQVRDRYKAMKRDRARAVEAATVHWHPMETAGANDPD